MTLNLCSCCYREFVTNSELCYACSIFYDVDPKNNEWNPDPNDVIYWLFVRDTDIDDNYGWNTTKK